MRLLLVVFLAAFLPLAQAQAIGTPTVTRSPSDLYTQATTFTFKITGTSTNPDYDTYRCAIDTGVPTPQCASGTDSHNGLSEGSHSYSAQFYSTKLAQLGPKVTISWTIDKTPPALQFTGSDSGNNGQKLKLNLLTEGFRVNSDENMGSYLCGLDVLVGANARASVSDCSSFDGQTSGSVTLSNMAVDGQDIKYRLNVTATDLAKNSAKITSSFNIDKKIPDIIMPTLNSPSLPDRYTQANVATFSFESPEAGVTFTCKLNQGNFLPCTSPTDYGSSSSPQPEGNYDFFIIGSDLAGNRQADFSIRDGQNLKLITKYTWTVDRSPPNVPDINTYPSDPSSNPNPKFTFAPPVPEIGGVTYLCEIKRPKSSFASFPCSETTTVATSSFPVPGVIGNALDSGPYTLRAQMKDGAGNIGKFNTYDWIIDLFIPVTKQASNFASPPDKLTKSPDKTFNFYATDQYVTRTDAVSNNFVTKIYDPCTSPECTFECHMDNDKWASCSSPHTVSGIVPFGKREFHTFYVRAVDEAGNDAVPISFRWEIDRVDVTLTWITTPSFIDNDVSELFVWTTTENYAQEPSTFTCQIDSRVPVACGGSPDSQGNYNFTAIGLTHGNHEFILVATDFVGNQGPQFKYSWTTDLINPIVSHSIIWGPSDYTNNPTAKFVFTTEVKATLYCLLTAGNMTVFPWERCSTRRSTASGEGNTYVYPNLPDDEYTFFARAIDEGGNVSPNVTLTFTVDTIGPATVFVAKPPRYTNLLSATFVANSTAYQSTYECQYISDRYTDIQSSWLSCLVRPFFATTTQDSWRAIQFTVVQFKEIAGQTIRYIDKPHVMKVRATDRAGNTGPPVSWTWEIDLIPPVLNFSNTENDRLNKIVDPRNLRWINLPSFTLNFFAKESTYTCQLQMYDFKMKTFQKGVTMDCSPNDVFSNITGGLYQILVRAYDYFGNTDNSSTNLPGYVLGLVGNGPVAQIVATPPIIDNTLMANFTLNVPFPGAGANCSVRRRDATSSKETWWVCVSPILSQKTYETTGDVVATFDVSTYVGKKDGKFDGEYIFKYHVFDQWGNRSPDVRYFWSIDIEDPRTALQYSTPEYTNNIDDVKFSYFSDELGITFMCRLDQVSLYDNAITSYSCPKIIGSRDRCNFEKCPGSGFQGNTSYPYLGNGIYEFSVKAVDKAGNEDKSPIVVRFTLDTDTPRLDIVDISPKLNVSLDDDITVAFAGELGSRFFCRIRQRYGVQNDDPNFTPCESPYTFFHSSGIREPGPFIAEIQVVDRAGNTGKKSFELIMGNTPSYPMKEKEFYNSVDLNPPVDCPNYDTIMAAVAIAGFAVFAIFAVLFPLIILSRMNSGSPSSFDTKSKRKTKSEEVEGVFSKRPLEGDYD